MSLSTNGWFTDAEDTVKVANVKSDNIYSKYFYPAGHTMDAFPTYNLIRNAVVLVPNNQDITTASYAVNKGAASRVGGMYLMHFGDKNVDNFPVGGTVVSIGARDSYNNNPKEHQCGCVFANWATTDVGDNAPILSSFTFDPSKVRIHYGFWFLSGVDYRDKNPMDYGYLYTSLINLKDTNGEYSDYVISKNPYDTSRNIFDNAKCKVSIYQPRNTDVQPRGVSGISAGVSWDIIDFATPLVSNSTTCSINGLYVNYLVSDTSKPSNAYFGAPYICAFGENEQDLFDSFDPSNFTIY